MFRIGRFTIKNPLRNVFGVSNSGKHHMHSQCTISALNTLSNDYFGLKIRDESTNPNMTILINFTKLRTLNLSCPRVSYMPVLGKLPNLENVCIYDTPIKSLEMFRNNKKIKNLTLRNTHVQDLDPLKYCSHLISLRLESNRYLPKQQIEWLKEKLPKCEINIR